MPYRTKPWKHQLIKLYSLGTPTKRIAAMLGKSPWSVRHHLRQCGVTLQMEIEFRDNLRESGVRVSNLHRARV